MSDFWLETGILQSESGSASSPPILFLHQVQSSSFHHDFNCKLSCCNSKVVLKDVSAADGHSDEDVPLCCGTQMAVVLLQYLVLDHICVIVVELVNLYACTCAVGTVGLHSERGFNSWSDYVTDIDSSPFINLQGSLKLSWLGFFGGYFRHCCAVLINIQNDWNPRLNNLLWWIKCRNETEQNPERRTTASNSCSHLTPIPLNLWYFQSRSDRICTFQMEAVLVFMPFWYSHSRPFLVSWRVLHALHSPSLFVLSKSACLPLKPPLLLRLWCESGRRQWVLTCQLSWLPEGWLWARVC